MRAALLSLCLMACACAWAQSPHAWRASTPQEQPLDAAAFDGFDKRIEDDMGDVQSLVVVLKGRTLYEYYRDRNPDTLRDAQSVTKSALALLVGAMLQRGALASIDQPVVELMLDWAPLNADARARAITLRHLLAMTPGFDIHDATGTAPPLAPALAWARPLRAAPGEQFAYDNSSPVMVTAILERASGRPVADLVQEYLVVPLGMKPPSYRRGSAYMRTADMARLVHLLWLKGEWEGRAVLPAGFAAQVVKPESAGGPPAGRPYGLYWWIAAGPTFFASGYAGQAILVHAPSGLVVAVTSTVSPQSQQRNQAMRLARVDVFEAVQRRLAPVPASASASEPAGR